MNPWELASWDAVETAARIRRREVSAAEVAQAARGRASTVKSLGAIVTDISESPQVSATGAFAGVPTFVKDLTQVAGVPTGFGSATAAGYVSKRDDASVGAFRRMGFALLGKSATPEFGLIPTTEPLGQAPCRNPHAHERTPGGSSGGAAALVAAGVVPLAHGSDGGGSIRIPAACCGLVGLKPTRSRFDMEGSPYLPVNIATHGVLTRTVRDTVAFWQAVGQVAPSRRWQRIDNVSAAPRRRLRIGVFSDTPRHRLTDPDVKRVLEETVRLLGSLGHEVREVPCPYTENDVEDFTLLWAYVSALHRRIGPLLIKRFDKSKLEPWTHGFADRFRARLGSAVRGLRRLRAYQQRYLEALGSLDALLCPTISHPAPLLGHLRTDVPFEECLARVEAFVPYTGFLNAAGAPGITLPLGRTAQGLPVGMQLAARAGEETVLLELALELEQAQPWPTEAPRS